MKKRNTLSSSVILAPAVNDSVRCSGLHELTAAFTSYDLASSSSDAKLLFCKFNRVFATHDYAFAPLPSSVFHLITFDTQPK